MTNDRHAQFLAFIRASEHRARCYIQGSAYHEKLKSVQPISGGWSVHFKSHPRVIEAEAEGWGRDLRAALVAECKQRLMHNQDLGEPDDLMPNRKEWWDGARENARRVREADNAGDVAEAEPRGVLPRVDRDAWRARREGRKPKPIDSVADGVLTELSQRISGG
jgi:hypothetical protein